MGFTTSKAPKRILPAKHKSIAAAPYLGAGAGDRIPYRRQSGIGASCAGTHTSRPHRANVARLLLLSLNSQRTIRKVRIGEYPTVGLAEARRRAAGVIEAVERGEDPAGRRKARNAAKARRTLTFADLVEDHLADLAKRRTTKHVRDVRNALNDKAMPRSATCIRATSRAPTSS